jgi:hypothetical protein
MQTATTPAKSARPRRFTLTDVSGQTRVTVDVAPNGELTPRHTVDHTKQFFVERAEIGTAGVTAFSAFSRGVRLHDDALLGDLHELDVEWRIVPEVSAG